MFRSHVSSVKFFCAAVVLAATAACGGAGPDGASISDDEVVASESGAEALRGDGHEGRCRYRDRHSHEESYSDYYGRERSCTPGHRDRWFDQCRDHHDDTEEYACEPTSSCDHNDEWRCDNHESGWSRNNGCCEYRPGHDDHHDRGPRCLYRRHGQVSMHDYFGRERSCTPGHRDEWFETCRDQRGETEEVGCECPSGYDFTNCWGQWTCMPHGSVC